MTGDFGCRVVLGVWSTAATLGTLPYVLPTYPGAKHAFQAVPVSHLVSTCHRYITCHRYSTIPMVTTPHNLSTVFALLSMLM